MRGLVDELGTNDVLLGRGTGPNEHQGNKSFRNLAIQLLLKSTTKENSEQGRASLSKIDLAKRLVDLVHSRNGRFVRQLSKAEVTVMERSQPTNRKLLEQKKIGDLFAIVDENVALEKAKQCIRHQLLVIKRTKDSRGSNALESPHVPQGHTGNTLRPVKKRPCLSSQRESVYRQVKDSRKHPRRAFEKPASDSKKEDRKDKSSIGPLSAPVQLKYICPPEPKKGVEHLGEGTRKSSRLLERLRPQPCGARGWWPARCSQACIDPATALQRGVALSSPGLGPILSHQRMNCLLASILVGSHSEHKFHTLRAPMVTNALHLWK